MDRLSTATRLVWYPEGASTPDADTGITSGVVVPLNAQSGYGDSSDPIEVPVFMGRGLLPFALVSGPINAGGAMPTVFECEFAGWPRKAFYGPNGYLHVVGTKLHEWFIPVAVGARPGSFQLQGEFLEAPAQYHRGRGNRVSAISGQIESAGAAVETIDVVGTGNMVLTDLGGTKVDNGCPASSYMDGTISYTAQGVTTSLAATIAGFRRRLFNGATRRDAFLNGGKAGDVNAFAINGEFEIALTVQVGGTGPAADLNAYLDAINNRDVDLDIVQADAPLGSTTKFHRVRLAALRLFRMPPKPGGQQPVSYTLRGRIHDTSNAKIAGEYFGPTVGPFNIGASNNKLGIKRDGGATTEVTLTQGAARTAVQVVADINAAIAGAADAFLDQYVRIKSATKGASSSVQIDTAVVNSGHALFGFDGTVRAGRDNCPIIESIFNSRVTPNE